MEKQVDTLDGLKLQKLPIIDSKNPGKKYSEKEDKHLSELVQYEFMNLEEAGLMQKFSYGNAKNVYKFTLFHGGKYMVPRFIARHVESKATPMWKWKPDGSGSLEKQLVGYDSRFQMREVYD